MWNGKTACLFVLTNTFAPHLLFFFCQSKPNCSRHNSVAIVIDFSHTHWIQIWHLLHDGGFILNKPHDYFFVCAGISITWLSVLAEWENVWRISSRSKKTNETFFVEKLSLNNNILTFHDWPIHELSGSVRIKSHMSCLILEFHLKYYITHNPKDVSTNQSRRCYHGSRNLTLQFK